LIKTPDTGFTLSFFEIVFVVFSSTKECMLKTLHPGRFPEGPGRVSGRKTGSFSTGCKTLHPGRYPEGPGRVSGSKPGRFF
jgi:hypothetical protein